MLLVGVLWTLTGVLNADDRFPAFTDDPVPDLRRNTPNDPRFDCAESDDEDAARCADFWKEQYQLFGFAPDGTEHSAIYREGPAIGKPQVSGVSVDLAWKTTIGSPDVVVAVLDTGIRWDNPRVRRQIWINRGELPRPMAGDVEAADWDADGDGAFTVDDYARDPRVDPAANGIEHLDAQDLILAFSDGTDADGNGYVDDIAGWDFLDDDNDPSDVSSYTAATNHGTGRALEVAEQTHDGEAGAGICPRCRVMMLRTYDVFVMPGDNWAAGTAYAVDNGALVEVVANGLLHNTRTAKAMNRYAYEHGMALMHVSSDLNTANHNYPTNYVESIFINGCVADAPSGGSNEIAGLADYTARLGVNLAAPVQTWFRQANLTQHGAHAHVCFVGDTGSQDTGQAGGAAGLIHSRGLELAKAGKLRKGPLSANEVKQLLTMTAEDVLPFNTVGLGIPDRAQQGWDEHFGYGRAHVGRAVRAVKEGRIPPEALIRDPAWWAMLDPKSAAVVRIEGEARARRSALCSYDLEWAVGVEPADDAFEKFVSGADCTKGQGAGRGATRLLGELDVAQVASRLPGSMTGKPPEDPNEFVISVRLRVTDAEGNVGEDRKAWFVYHDPTWHPGWPKFVDTGGESSPVLYDLDGNGTLEIIEANSSGELWVWNHDGRPLASFNGGQPWQLEPTYFYHAGSRAFKEGGVPPPTGGFRTPAIADLDNDFVPDIVAAAADGRIVVLRPDGSVRLRLGVDPALSTPATRDRGNHPKPGILGSPVIADLDNDGGAKEIIVAALDGHVYVWSGEDGSLRSGFPKKLADPGEASFYGGELIATPAVGNLDDDPQLEIVSGSNEVYGAVRPEGPGDLKAAVQGLVTNLLANAIGGSSRIYAINDDGSLVPGWPVKINGILPDVLPLVGPQHAVALADFDGDGVDEVVASITTGDLHVIRADGSMAAYASEGVVNGGAHSDAGKVLNLFEYAAIGDLNGFGGLDIASGGITSGGVANLLLTGQNLPQNHVVQAWDYLLPESYLPGYPVATDDYQLLSTPAIADVDGSGTREIVVGTGLYLVHAYNIYGEDAAGFPKLAGGWLYNVPAIGDIDADGLLEMVAGTREGWRFVWDLAAPASPSTNAEWWTEAHDECHTNNYGTDCRPPGAILDARVEGGQVLFTAPGDDWNMGRVARYELRRAPAPVRDLSGWQAATPLPDMPAQTPGGGTARIPVPPGGGYLVIVAVDDAGLRGRPVSVRLP